MDLDYKFLSQTLLFANLAPIEIEKLLNSIDYSIKKFKKSEIIYSCGTTNPCLGIVLYGNVQIENIDFWGNKSILDHLSSGKVFAEAYACMKDEPLMVDVISLNESSILLINLSSFFNSQTLNPLHLIFYRNLFNITIYKNLHLTRRSFHTAPKSIRGKLISYLSTQATIEKSQEFMIPFNRQQLADYLNVDRSALSNELSKMQKDGLISINKNRFILSKSID